MSWFRKSPTIATPFVVTGHTAVPASFCFSFRSCVAWITLSDTTAVTREIIVHAFAVQLQKLQCQGELWHHLIFISYSSHILILSHVVHVPCPALCRQEAENAIKTTKNIRHQRPRSTVLHVWLTPTPAGVIRPNGCAAAAVRRYPATNP